jgi:putative membrane protein
VIRSSAISLAVGLAAAVSLVAANDPASIAGLLLQAGWAVPAIVALHLPQTAFSALGWAPLVRDPRRPGWAVLFRLRWIRESVNNLLPVAQVGGEIASAQLLARHGVAGAAVVASLVVDLATEMVAQVAFAAAGLAALAALPHRSGDLSGLAVAGATGLAAAMAGAFIAAQRWGLFRLVERMLPDLGGRFGWLALGGAAGLHDAAASLYREPRRLWLSGAAHLVSWLLGTLEIWAGLHFLGADVGLAEALVIESLSQVLRSAGFFVPASIGVQEGALVLTCALFGIPAEQAVALSLLRRLRDIALGVPGIVAWRWEAAALRVGDGRPAHPAGGTP